MTKRERDALDRHITGNYGEDQFSDDDQRKKLFDITCRIGSVWEGEMLDGMSPREAAFSLIGRHEAEGEYKFPFGPDGGMVTVNVEFDKPEGGK